MNCILLLTYEFIPFLFVYEFIYSHLCLNSYTITIAVAPYDCYNMLTTNTSDDSVQENCIEASMSKILCMSSDLNTWTSKFVVTHGDKSIDVSLAAQGCISTFPFEISPTQKIEYSWTK